MQRNAVPKVVIVGGGFGGLAAAKALRKADVSVTLVDRANHHLFQPLLYQVATSGLSPADIAAPFREIFRKQKNLRLLLDEAVAVDRKNRLVYLKSKDELEYDYLILAAGANNSYFGNDDWALHAPGLKTLTDALEIRERTLLAFEMAECAQDKLEREELLTFVVVGGGPTGVEMAGALAELAGKTVRRDYPALRDEPINVMLVEGGDRVLKAFSPELSARAEQDLKELGVDVMLNTRVTYVSSRHVQAGDRKIPANNVVWAAGNQAASLNETLDTELDRMGRAVVNQDLTLPGDPHVFVIGDAAHCKDENGEPLPGLAPAATQMGQYAAKMIAEKQPPEWRKPFQYWDKGTMATIGRARAIAEIGKFKFSGLFAWLMWGLVHVALLVNFRNRTRVMLEWIWMYVSFKPGVRLLYPRKSAMNRMSEQRH